MPIPAAKSELQAPPASWVLHYGRRNRRGFESYNSVCIHPSIHATGVAAFAFRILSLLPQWEAQWSSLIDHIGHELNADVRFLWKTNLVFGVILTLNFSLA